MNDTPPRGNPGGGRYTFDLSRCVVFDVEVYPGRWCVGFHGPGSTGVTTTRVVETRNDLRRMLDYLDETGRTLVGFNSDAYDVPVVRALLKGLDPFALSCAIVRGEDFPVPLAKLPAFPCDHIDLASRLKRAGRFPGLKSVAANLGRPLLRELPYPPDTAPDDRQWGEIRDYNRVDLEHTWALLERLAPELEALSSLSDEQGVDLRSTPTPRVVESLFLNAYRRKNGGRKPSVPEVPQEILYRPPAGVRRPETPEAGAWFDRITAGPIPVVERAGSVKIEAPAAKFLVGRVNLSVGIGGIHSDDAKRLHYATRTHALVSVDVASYYPSLIASKGIAPRSYGDSGAETYRALRQRRLDAKAGSKAAEDPAEGKRLAVQADALKLVLNSTFGKYGDRFSSLFDPEAMAAVTLTGQLMLVDLIERLRKAGARVLSVNTDGLFLKVRRTNTRWPGVLDTWQADTGMELEVEHLRRLLLLATNRYATLDVAGKVKRKGTGLKGSFSPLQPANELVVADAVADALLKDVPPERTVWGCAEPARFCRITRKTSKVISGVMVDEADGTEVEIPKVTRWYKARGSTRKIVHRFEGGRHTTPSHAVNVELALDLTDGKVPEDLDRSWYVRQARKEVQSVPGYRHRSRRLLRVHAPALEAHALGLAPCAKTDKGQPAGSDAARPSYLYDWPRYPTTGTYTGPGVGLLVIDADEADRFRLAVDKGNSPLLANRWRDFDGCLVSVRGDATADQVRRGQARGKLIFRFEAGADHPFARMRVEQWKKSRGVEVFYGKGIPSVLGRHPSGETYRLEGTLTPLPEWAEAWLTPKGRAGAQAAPTPREGEPVEVPDEARGALLLELAELHPVLGRATVHWRSKGLGDGRVMWVGRCPFEHESGTSADGDLGAGFRPDGSPYLKCKHASCTESQGVNDRLAERHPRTLDPWTMTVPGPAAAAPVESPEIVPTDIARVMLDDLSSRFVSLHVAPTGSGKSYSAAQVGAVRYYQGLATLIALPTIRLAEETVERLQAFAPHAFQADAVAKVYGGKRPDLDERWEGEGEADEADEGGQYPIHDGTRVVVCTHQQLGRRGFSKYLRGIWTKLGADEEGDRPAFAFLIDEASEFIREARREVELAHRTGNNPRPDGTGGMTFVRERCPKFTHSGHCGACTLVRHGGVSWFNRFSIRELKRPPNIEIDADGRSLRTPFDPLTVGEADLGIGEWVRITTAFAAPVLSAYGKRLDEATRRTAPLWVFTREKDDKGVPKETNEEVLAHMLEFALTPVVTREHPVNDLGEKVDSGTLALRINQGDKKWDEGIVFPRDTCEVPRLRFTDLLGLEKIRRFAAGEKVGVVFAGATLGPGDAEVLRAVWPKMVDRHHPYPPRKVKQVAVVAPDGYRGGASLIGADGRLITAPLEAHGKGLVFCATKGPAEALYDAISLKQPAACLAVENSQQTVLRKTLHHAADIKTIITYSRGVLGLGANTLGVRHLVVDANAFRAIASFTPGEVSPEEFQRLQVEERLSVILQNVGRVLRGEEGKVAVLIVLNADKLMLDALAVSRGVVEGSELPPVVVTGKDLVSLIDQSGRWLAAGGGDWPTADPAKKGPRSGRPSKCREDVYRAAEDALAAGTSWREFRQKCHPQRILSQEDMDALKARFARSGV